MTEPPTLRRFVMCLAVSPLTLAVAGEGTGATLASYSKSLQFGPRPISTSSGTAST